VIEAKSEIVNAERGQSIFIAEGSKHFSESIV
jgi:hypothetical protein